MKNDEIDKMIFQHFNRSVITLKMRNKLKITNEYINIEACELIIIENIKNIYHQKEKGKIIAYDKIFHFAFDITD